MCRDCIVCGQNHKLSKDEILKRKLVVFDGKKYGNVYPIARCRTCGCSWISDVGGFAPPE